MTAKEYEEFMRTQQRDNQNKFIDKRLEHKVYPFQDEIDKSKEDDWHILKIK